MQGDTDVVVFNYQMMNRRGKLLESNQGQPLAILQGQKQVFQPLEKALFELKPGDKRQVSVRCQEAYGEYKDDFVVQVPRTEFEKTPQIGDDYTLTMKDGSSVKMWVADEKEDFLILDGNHPLAGIDLLFEVEVLQRRPATADEIASGQIQMTR